MLSQDRPSLLPSLTGLRFLAALLVFGRHAEALYDGTPLEWIARRSLFQGTVGVSFFYILSGFVLTWSRRTGDTPWRFYRRRFARIYPNYVVAWVLGGLMTLYVAGTIAPKVAAVTLVLLQSWVPDDRYFSGMDGVTWSLSCEFFFYALFPLMILMLPKLPAAWRRTLALALVLTVGVLPILALHLISVPVHQLWFVYIFPPTRLLEFMLGLLVALEVQAGGFRWLRLRYAAALTLLAYLLAGQAGIHRPDLVPGTMSYAAFTALPLALLIAATARADIGQAVSFLRSRWSVRLGEWSYAFYLVHLPIILTFEHAFGTHRADVWRALAATAVLLALSTAVAAALYTFVEHPMERRLRGSVRPSALILEAPGAIAVRQTLPEPRPQ